MMLTIAFVVENNVEQVMCWVTTNLTNMKCAMSLFCACSFFQLQALLGHCKLNHVQPLLVMF